MSHRIIDFEKAGLVLINCTKCNTIYPDLKRDEFTLYCPYCGERLK